MLLHTPPQNPSRPIPRDLPLVAWITADDAPASDEEPASGRPARFTAVSGLTILGLVAAVATVTITVLSLLSLGGWDACTATFALP